MAITKKMGKDGRSDTCEPAHQRGQAGMGGAAGNRKFVSHHESAGKLALNQRDGLGHSLKDVRKPSKRVGHDRAANVAGYSSIYEGSAGNRAVPFLAYQQGDRRWLSLPKKGQFL
jgi:hypothetical protein